MFEEMTYEAILDDMLARVISDVDKREGSIIYDALAPAAYHLAQAYYNLNNYIDLFFVDTAVAEYLDRKAADYGIVRRNATYAVRKIVTSGTVNIGTRWGIENLTYIITEQIGINMYSASCGTAGTIGNIYNGVLENIDNVYGVTAELTDVILGGSDTELDDALRIRIQDYVSNPAQDGNIAQYKQWAIEYPGVGTAKVFPLWNGGNTVKIAITDSDNRPANNILVSKFQEYMDPGATGLGNGMAPIGSKVTVVSGTAKNITISANVVLSAGYSDATDVSDAIENYLSSIAYKKDSVNYMRIGSVILDCASIADVNGLTVNGGMSDIPLVGTDIPVLSSINLTKVTV